MRQRRTIRAITAAVAAASAGLVSAVLALPAAAADVAVVSNDFEGGSAAPWGPRGGTTVTIVDTDAHQGTHSLQVTGRTANWHGTEANITSVVEPGGTYDFSGFVKLTPGTADTAVKFTLIFDGSDFQQVGSNPIASDEVWVEIGGTYTIPASATSVVLYVEAAEATASFLVDDIEVFGPEVGSTPDPTTETLFDLDFDTQSFAPWTHNGGTHAWVADGDGGSALSVTRTADYEGIQSPPGSLVPGTTYTLSMRATAAEGDSGEVRFVARHQMPDNDDEDEAPQTHYTWIGNTTVTDAGWTTISGTFALPADALDNAVIFIGSTNQMDGETSLPWTYVVDDVLVTFETGEPPYEEYSGTWDFETGTAEGWVPRQSQGNPTVAATDAEAHGGTYSLAVTDRTGQGDGAGYDFTEHFVPGVTYDITAWVKTAEGQPADSIWLSARTGSEGSYSYGTVAQFADIGSTEWTQVTTTYTMPSTPSVFLYFETAYANGELGTNTPFLLDDITVVSQEPSPIQDLPSIYEEFAGQFPVGVAIDARETLGAPSELTLRHFNQITAENHMKVEAWYDAERNFRMHEQADALLQFAQDNGLGMYGHVLLWHSQTPDWFFQDEAGEFLTSSEADKAIMTQRLETHINNVAEAISDEYGLFGSDTNPMVGWDVVNEVVNDQASPATNGLRNSYWYQILGEDYIDLAFQFADEAFNETYAVPDEVDARPIALFINDYNTEQSGKQNRYYDLVQRLLDRDVPIDGVGHQFHVSLSMPVDALEAAIVRFQDTGLIQAVTELDVTVGNNPTNALLIEQGYYYRDAFRVFREYAEDLFSVTIWGLSDNRSWRSEQAPLVFDGRLQAKPAYYGIMDDPSMPLPPRARTANVFAGSLPIGAAAFDHVTWDQLPLHPIEGVADFQLRWAPDHLTAYISVDDATVQDTDAVTFTYGDTEITVERDAADTATQVVRSTASGWEAVVRLPLATPVAQGGTMQLNVEVTDGATTTAWAPEGGGTLSLLEALSYVEVVEAPAAPLIDGAVDDVWDMANVVVTEKYTQGSEGGAYANVRTLWSGDGDVLYVLMDVIDDELDAGASNPWDQDSVEIYIDRGNFKNGSYRYDDNQIRIDFQGDISFGTGDEAFQEANVDYDVAVTDTGYVVEVAINLLESYGGPGTFHGVDFQVNDAAAGVRTSVRNWADPTGLGYQSTARWGVAQLVPAVDEPGGSGIVTMEPVRAVSDAQVPAGIPVCVPMAGQFGVPENATGVMVNVTTVRPNGPGYVVVYPDGGTAPATSTVNFETGQDVANTTFVGLGPDGGLCYRVTGPTQVGILIDVAGYVTEESGVVMTTPERLLDTRAGAGHVGDITGPVAPRTVQTVDVAGKAGVPADATAVILNVTVPLPTALGNLRVYPAGDEVPNASVLNYAPGREKANTTIVQLPESGDISFYSDTFPGNGVQVILDVVGYMTADTLFTGVTPERVLDTREDEAGPLAAGEGLLLDIAGMGPVPAGATSVMLNVTAVQPTANGNLRVFPDPSGVGEVEIPDASNINYIPGRDIPNLVVVDVPASGTIAFYNDMFAGQVHVVVDVVGFVGPVGPAAKAPAQVGALLAR